LPTRSGSLRIRVPTDASADARENVPVPEVKPRPHLNTDDIVDTALALISEGGVANLSMRQLSKRLGASLGATYRHLPTKEALLELCGKALFDRSWSPLGEDEDPLEWLQRQIMNLYTVVSEHRGMAAYVLRYNRSASRDIVDPVHQVLLDSGFGEDEATIARIVLMLYTTGALLSDFEHTVAAEAPDPRALVAAGMSFILSSGRSAGTAKPVEKPAKTITAKKPAAKPATTPVGKRPTAKAAGAETVAKSRVRTGKPTVESAKGAGEVKTARNRHQRGATALK
jgi:AcrR family transcriptional regulator